jgi:2-dehydropantoate 2-reductase
MHLSGRLSRPHLLVNGVYPACGILARDSTILTLQNDLGGAEWVAAVVGLAPLLIGVAGGFGAAIAAPGQVHHNGWEFVHLGEHGGGRTPRQERVGTIWRKAGSRVQLGSDVQRMSWETFIGNVAFSGLCTLTGRTIGEVLADPEAWSVAAACATDAHAVARQGCCGRDR